MKTEKSSLGNVSIRNACGYISEIDEERNKKSRHVSSREHGETFLSVFSREIESKLISGQFRRSFLIREQKKGVKWSLKKNLHGFFPFSMYGMKNGAKRKEEGFI